MANLKKTDFTIVKLPAYITLECPYCGMDQTIPWDEVIEPEYWGDEWGVVSCPGCGEEIELGDYDVD